MKRKIILSVLTLILIFSSSLAFAEIQKFDHFSVDVPEGWDSDLQGTTLIVKSKNKNASVEVAFNKMGDTDLADIAERLYIEMDGTDLEEDEDGDFLFNFVNPAGVDSVALIMGAEGYYLVLSITGFDDESIQKDLEKILDTVNWND